jgi:transposase
MGKRKFTAEFKVQVVLEVLREGKELGVIAAEHEINPNQLRTWKKEFLDKAPGIFEENRQSKDAARREKDLTAEKEDMLKTIGQLTMERDFLKKKSIQVFGPDYEKKFT